MRPLGGSEILNNNLLKYTGQDWQERVNLVLSVCDPAYIDPNRVNVIWQHLAYDQGAIRGMADSNFIQSIEHFVYVSNWQKEQFQNRFPINLSQNHVIKNAIEPIEFKEKPKDKIKLIYTSTPNRGLEVLLKAFKILNRKDIELIVFSSNIIYGKGYSNQLAGAHEHLFHQCRTTPGITYRGYAMNKAVRQALQQSHILAYPSIYEETSCLAAIEAGAAGCKIVTTDLGALPESCDKWATYVNYQYGDNLDLLAERYAETLNTAIDSYWTNSYTINEQSLWFNEQYSWHTRAREWLEFFSKICVK
jgi:glycosyltransferase involved in cell wall biosynthesis